MTLVLQQETLYDVIHEIEELFERHYQELTLNKDKVRLNPRYREYTALEQLGMFHLFTARKEGKLVGYSAFFLNTHMHYADLKVAMNDVLFLDKDNRLGTAGIKLIRFSEERLKSMGAHKITWHIKFAQDFRPILHRMGYTDEEVIVGKLF